jgi:hypothetical protein
MTGALGGADDIRAPLSMKRRDEAGGGRIGVLRGADGGGSGAIGTGVASGACRVSPVCDMSCVPSSANLREGAGGGAEDARRDGGGGGARRDGGGKGGRGDRG